MQGGADHGGVGNDDHNGINKHPIQRGKGDSDCIRDGDGNSDSEGNTFNNEQTLQAVMECRGELTMEEGAMMMMMELVNIPFGRVGRGDSDCDGNGDNDSDSDGEGNGDDNGNVNCDGGSGGNDDGNSEEA